MPNELEPNEETPERAEEATRQDETPPPTPEELADLRGKAAECDALEEKLKRVAADFLNSQKRLERLADERVAYAIEEFARELLVVSDDLARAVSAARERQTVEAILDGLRIVEKHLYDVLERHGVTVVETETGKPFDPELHEAISVVPSREYEPNHIVEEIQKGFLIHKRLLRPARVIVSAEAQAEGSEE